MQPLINDATTALLRAIHVAFGDFKAITFEDIRSRSWASVSFVGARHKLTLRLDGAAAEAAAAAFLDNLEAAEFTLRGHILADIGLISRERTAGPTGEARVRIRIEALTVEDS